MNIRRKLRHQNVLPLYGVSRDLLSFEKDQNEPISLASPWMEKGDLMSYVQENPLEDHICMVCIAVE